MVGTTAGGTISPARTKKLTTAFHLLFRAREHVAGHRRENDHDRD